MLEFAFAGDVEFGREVLENGAVNIWWGRGDHVVRRSEVGES